MTSAKKLVPVVAAALLVILAGTLWMLQRRPGPVVAFEGVPATLGHAKRTVTVAVTVPTGSLATLEARVVQGAAEKPVALAPGATTLELDAAALGLVEGPAELKATATDDAWRPSALSPSVATASFVVDLTPPVVEFVSATTYVKHGGAALAVFRAVGAASAAVEVGTESFAAESGLASDPAVRVALYTLPYREPVSEPKIVAADEAGNRRVVSVPVQFLGTTFGTDEITLGADFLRRKVPELDPQTPGDASEEELLRRFLAVNGEGRAANEARFREVATAGSEPRPAWTGAFRQQPNSQVFASFPEKRAYFHGGKQVDQQWHLGIDMASNARSPILASNAGKVVFAEANGIYGNTVVLDHGLGLFSLYGHLSTIEVQPGQRVAQGDVLGRSGETGSAAGDHLHFGMLVRGVYTNPIEWLDAGWIHDRFAKPLVEAGISLPGITDLAAPVRGQAARPSKGKAPPARRRGR